MQKTWQIHFGCRSFILIMSDMSKGYRLSAVQKDVLFVLYALRERGKTTATPATALLKIINKGREIPLFATNFRTSCHTLAENGLTKMYRNESLKLYFELSESGLEVAKDIYNERTKEE